MAEQKVSTANIIEIIAILLPVVAKYGPMLVQQIMDMVKNDPNLPVEQIAAQIEAKLQDAAKNNAVVIE